jgi:hypothetical protein
MYVASTLVYVGIALVANAAWSLLLLLPVVLLATHVVVLADERSLGRPFRRSVPELQDLGPPIPLNGVEPVWHPAVPDVVTNGTRNRCQNSIAQEMLWIPNSGKTGTKIRQRKDSCSCGNPSHP